MFDLKVFCSWFKSSIIVSFDASTHVVLQNLFISSNRFVMELNKLNASHFEHRLANLDDDIGMRPKRVGIGESTSG